jgi:hypothetical protein
MLCTELFASNIIQTGIFEARSVNPLSRKTPTGLFISEMDKFRTDDFKPQINCGRDYEMHSVEVSFNLRPINSTEVVLQSLVAANPHTGEGSKAMRTICLFADRCGVVLLLDASPFSTKYKEQPNDREAARKRLMTWYEKFGFRITNGSEMRRDPS